MAARLAGRPGGRDTWPDIGVVGSSLQLPPGVVVRQLSRSDVPKVLSVLPEWYPPLQSSSLSFILAPEFYEAAVALAGEEARVEHRPGFAYVVEVNGELAVFSYLSCDVSRSRTLRAELAVIGPAHRRLNLSTQLTPLCVLVARALEVETILGWATLSHPYAQLACERQGFDLIGVVPASDSQVIAPGVVKHVFEAVYAVSLVPPEVSLCPPLSSMPERVAALARFVLGERAR